MLELVDISKRFGRRSPSILQRVHLQAAPGAITVVQGRSGGGKTTLLRIIAGLEPPTGGRVRLDGVDLARTPPEDRDVALAFQSLVVYPHLSVAGNVRMAAEAGGRRGAARAEAVEAALAATGLADLAGRRPGAMSGGQLQRLALARMLARRPRMCLLDEPLAHLDPPARLALREIMTRLREEERIVLLVTHDAGEAMRMADHLVVLAAEDAANGGGAATVAAAGSPDEMARRPATQAVADATGLDPVNLVPLAVMASVAGPPPPGGATHLGVRPETVAARPVAEDPGGEGLRARLLDRRLVPGGIELTAGVPGPRPFRIRAIAAAGDETGPAAGDEVRLSWPAAAAWWFDAEGRRLDG